MKNALAILIIFLSINQSCSQTNQLLDMVNNMIKGDSTQYHWYILRGLGNLDADQYEEAIYDLTFGLEKMKFISKKKRKELQLEQVIDSAAILTFRGHAYALLQKSTKAILDYESVYLLTNDTLKTFIMKGEALLINEKYLEAKKLYSQAALDFPKQYEILNGLSYCLFQLGDHENGCIILNQAIELENKNNFWSLMMKAQFLASENNQMNACQLYKSSFNSFQDNLINNNRPFPEILGEVLKDKINSCP